MMGKVESSYTNQKFFAVSTFNRQKSCATRKSFTQFDWPQHTLWRHRVRYIVRNVFDYIDSVDVCTMAFISIQLLVSNSGNMITFPFPYRFAINTTHTLWIQTIWNSSAIQHIHAMRMNTIIIIVICRIHFPRLGVKYQENIRTKTVQCRQNMHQIKVCFFFFIIGQWNWWIEYSMHEVDVVEKSRA